MKAHLRASSRIVASLVVISLGGCTRPLIEHPHGGFQPRTNTTNLPIAATPSPQADQFKAPEGLEHLGLFRSVTSQSAEPAPETLSSSEQPFEVCEESIRCQGLGAFRNASFALVNSTILVENQPAFLKVAVRRQDRKTNWITAAATLLCISNNAAVVRFAAREGPT